MEAFWQSFWQSVELILESYLDGFWAVLMVATVAPILGVLLVLRRLPLLALAVPKLAGCGQAAAIFVFGILFVSDATQPTRPPAWGQALGACLVVGLGLVLLLALVRDRRFLGVHAGIAYLVASAGEELFYLESKDPTAMAHGGGGGGLLTVLPAGRNVVLLTGAVLLLVLWRTYGRQWRAAFDPDQARLNGLRPGRWLGLTLVLIALLCGLCVPVVGAEVVLSAMLIPPAVLRGASPSLAWFAPLSVFASVLGSVAAFGIACTETIDWPPTPTLVLSLLVSSGVVALVVRCVTRIRR